jgi:hypothetical protein
VPPAALNPEPPVASGHAVGVASVREDDANAPTSGAGADNPATSGGLALFDNKTIERFRDDWRQLQLRFVDDPTAAAGQASALVDDVVTALREAVERQRSTLEGWHAGREADETGDTEELRIAVRRYRDFLDRILGAVQA